MEVKVLQTELEEASQTLQTLSSSGELERQTLVEEMDVAQTLELLRGEKKRKIEEEPITIQTSPVSSPPQETKNKPKKKRRKRDEIERNFRCTVSGCTKSYGSEGALKTHIKLKHHDIPIAVVNASKTQATIHNRGDRAWAPVAIKAPTIGMPTVPDVPPATLLPPLQHQQQTACPTMTLPPISAITNGTSPQRVALPNPQRYDFSIFPLSKDNSLFKGVKIV